MMIRESLSVSKEASRETQPFKLSFNTRVDYGADVIDTTFRAHPNNSRSNTLITNEPLDDSMLRLIDRRSTRAVAFPGIQQIPDYCGVEISEDAQPKGTQLLSKTGEYEVRYEEYKDNLFRLVDPRTGRPFTPGFDEIQDFDNEQVVILRHNKTYTIRAFPEEDSSWQQRLYTSQKHQASAVLTNLPACLLRSKLLIEGEERDFSPKTPEERAEHVFTAVLTGVYQYGIRSQSNRPSNEPLSLPAAKFDHQSDSDAQLHLGTLKDGTVIHFNVENDFVEVGSIENPQGFFLVQEKTGGIIVLDPWLNRSWTSGDQDYEQKIEDIRAKIEHYFSTFNLRYNPSDVVTIKK